MIMRVKAHITGPGGLPGIHTTYWLGASSTPVTADAVDVHGRVRAFWDGVKTLTATGVTITFPGPIDVLDHTNGNLQFTLNGGLPTNVVSTGSSELPKATQLILGYATTLVINGRFLKGRSFIGPLSTATNTGGSVTAASNVTLLAACAALTSGATASTQVVWHRPTASNPTAGAVSAVTGYSTNTEFGVLRSRRD